jgi:hypothetical protein
MPRSGVTQEIGGKGVAHVPRHFKPAFGLVAMMARIVLEAGAAARNPSPDCAGMAYDAAMALTWTINIKAPPAAETPSSPPVAPGAPGKW